MENESAQSEAVEPTPQPQLVIDKHIAVYLMETCKWGKFLAIMGFVGVGFMVVIGLLMMTVLSSFMSQEANMPFPAGLLGGFYLLIAVGYFFPSLYLLNFSNKTKLGLNSMSQIAMTEAFSNLKSLFKFMGVSIVVVLVIYGLILLGSIAVGIAAGLG
jgi:hypothetical protein